MKQSANWLHEENIEGQYAHIKIFFSIGNENLRIPELGGKRNQI